MTIPSPLWDDERFSLAFPDTREFLVAARNIRRGVALAASRVDVSARVDEGRRASTTRPASASARRPARRRPGPRDRRSGRRPRHRADGSRDVHVGAGRRSRPAGRVRPARRRSRSGRGPASGRGSHPARSGPARRGPRCCRRSPGARTGGRRGRPRDRRPSGARSPPRNRAPSRGRTWDGPGRNRRRPAASGPARLASTGPPWRRWRPAGARAPTADRPDPSRGADSRHDCRRLVRSSPRSRQARSRLPPSHDL